mgnify:CR=1 FL=1
MKVGARLAVTMTDQGVISDPVVEIQGREIVQVLADARDQEPDLYVDGILIPGLISTHTHLHGLVAYGHPVPAPAGFWPFLKEYWWPFVEDVLSADDVASLAAYAALHDWDGVFWYTLAHDHLVGEPPRAIGHFDLGPDPVKMTQLAAGALLFLRADVRPAEQAVTPAAMARTNTTAAEERRSDERCIGTPSADWTQRCNWGLAGVA